MSSSKASLLAVLAARAMRDDPDTIGHVLSVTSGMHAIGATSAELAAAMESLRTNTEANDERQGELQAVVGGDRAVEGSTGGEACEERPGPGIGPDGSRGPEGEAPQAARWLGVGARIVPELGHGRVFSLCRDLNIEVPSWLTKKARRAYRSHERLRYGLDFEWNRACVEDAQNVLADALLASGFPLDLRWRDHVPLGAFLLARYTDRSYRACCRLLDVSRSPARPSGHHRSARADLQRILQRHELGT